MCSCVKYKKSGTGLVLNSEYFNHLDQLNNLTIVDHTITLYAQWNAIFDDKQQPHAFDFNHELGCSLQ